MSVSHACVAPGPWLSCHMPIMSTVSPAGKDIEKACQGIYPLQNTYIRKVKVLRAPKFDVNKASQRPRCAVLSPHATALHHCFI